MKSAHLNYDHIGMTLVTGAGSKRKRGTLLDIEYMNSYIVATVRYTHGPLRVVLPNDTDIDIER
ncbi:hypothetical protein [Nocardia terpenica]|uniref:Uncharacterized protein n=1 Tax=Nocardia terpenica TaxID=455432 RepID=A0A164K759_9NOCA|nr:hypothetical protein [Nocardia terpenica]KZM71106.1 hypothetical protein AWN90_42090 [Nocardia terpenica]NQE89571.1 hypothetical protein [Nocardia terpenica]